MHGSRIGVVPDIANAWKIAIKFRAESAFRKMSRHTGLLDRVSSVSVPTQAL
jgi:hypothetical protein